MDLRSVTLILVVLALLVAVMTPSPAMAHAVLAAAEPADGARLERQPSEVRLTFNEPVSPVRVQVLDGSGAEVTEPHQVGGHGEMVHVALPPALSDGGYVVSYRVISVDGHPVVGSTVFVVGSGDPAVAAADRSGALAVASVAAEALHYLGLLAAAGGGLFVVLVMGRRHPLAGRVAPGLAAAAAVAVASGGLRIGLTGAMLVDGTLGGVVGAAAWSIGAGTSVAASAAVAAAGMALLGLGLACLRRSFAGVLLIVGAGAAILSLAASGHAASAPPRWLAMPLVALHGAAAAYWVGAFWPIAVLLAGAAPCDVLPVVRRFAAGAAAAVAVLVLAGAVLSVLQIGSLEAVVTTGYGRIWLAKMALVLALLALAACNRQVLTPALARMRPGAAGRLRRSVAVEGALAAAIAVATASFALGPPPRALAGPGRVDTVGTPHAGHDHAGHAAATAGRTVSAEARGRIATIAVDPARAGRNTITVHVAGPGGEPMAGKSTRIEMALPALGVEPITRDLTATGDGGYTLEDADLPIAGRWSLRLDLLVSDFEKLIFRAELPIGAGRQP